MKKVLSLLTLLVLMPSGPMLMAEGQVGSSPLIEQAEAARKEADALGYEWRDTAAIIQSAREALQKGQQEESDKLASLALLQSREGVAQAKHMAKNWKMMIPK